MDRFAVERIIRGALEEDLGAAGDLTTEAVVESGRHATAELRVRRPGRVAGLDVAHDVFRALDPGISVEVRHRDGDDVAEGAVLSAVGGSARAILSAERVALNLLGRMCGIATATRDVVRRVEGTGARIADTRKTTPGLRILEKHAVRMGGGINHRFGLGDAVMVKDNHVALAGSVAAAVEAVRRRVGHMVRVAVEAETLDEVAEVLGVGADVVLLDNMGVDLLREAVRMVDGRMLVEASGGITPATVRAIAETGVDVLSLGWLTHSVSALDVGLDVVVDD